MLGINHVCLTNMRLVLKMSLPRAKHLIDQHDRRETQRQIGKSSISYSSYLGFLLPSSSISSKINQNRMLMLYFHDIDDNEKDRKKERKKINCFQLIRLKLSDIEGKIDRSDNRSWATKRKKNNTSSFDRMSDKMNKHSAHTRWTKLSDGDEIEIFLFLLLLSFSWTYLRVALKCFFMSSLSFSRPNDEST